MKIVTSGPAGYSEENIRTGNIGNQYTKVRNVHKYDKKYDIKIDLGSNLCITVDKEYFWELVKVISRYVDQNEDFVETIKIGDE
jgi:hypothetical protein